jgi:stage V sporulation protein B
MHGALILVCATLIVKLIGFIYKIPLYNTMGEVGMGYYSAAYNIYVWFFTISTAGLPVAISKMIAIANADKNYREEKKIFRLSLIIFVIIGLFGSGVMFFGAKLFAGAAEMPDAYYSLTVISPTVLFICITSAYRGYFQGNHNMIPTAVSEVIESSGKLFVGLTAIWFAVNTLEISEDKHISAFAVSGLTIGVMAGALFLTVMKLINDRVKTENTVQNAPPLKVRSDKQIIREILKISLPITLSSSLISLSSFIDTFTMPRRLIGIGYTQDAAAGALGNYTTMAVSFFNFPNAIIMAFAVSIIPVIAEAFKKNDKKTLDSTSESTFRIVSMIAMPCAFGISCMSNPILNLLFDDKEAVAGTAPLLSVLAIGIVFVAMVSVTNTMLQAQGFENKPIISMACGAAVKLIVSYVLLGIPAVNRFGTPIGTCFGYFTIMGINFYFLKKHANIVPPVRKTFLKPFISSAVMSVCTILSYTLLERALNGSVLAVFAALVIAVGVYILLTLAFKTLTKYDVLLLPKGAKIYEAMKKKNLID